MRRPSFEKAVDTLRTAPTAIGAIAVGAIAAGAEAAGVSTGAISWTDVYSSAPLIAGDILYGSIEAKGLFDLKDRLKKALDRRGYDERLFKPSTEFWCQRQVARTVLNGTGHLHEYEKLCQSRRDGQNFAWLPNW